MDTPITEVLWCYQCKRLVDLDTGEYNWPDWAERRMMDMVRVHFACADAQNMLLAHDIMREITCQH